MPLSDGAPLYRRVKEQLVREIGQGRYPVTDPLPSEQKLAARFGVAQGTVRRALDELARENLVIRHQGRGTFVHAHGPERDRFHFFHLVAGDGERRLPTSRVLSLSRRRATQGEALALNLAPHDRVVEIKRVRDLMARPAILEAIVLPDARFSGLGDLNKSQLPNTLYQLYQDRFGVIIHRAVEKLTAEAAGVRVAMPRLSRSKEAKHAQCVVGEHFVINLTGDWALGARMTSGLRSLTGEPSTMGIRAQGGSAPMARLLSSRSPSELVSQQSQISL